MARIYPPTAKLISLIAALTLAVTACTSSAPAGSLRGNPESPAKPQNKNPSGAPATAAAPAQVRLIDSTELGLVYGLLFQEYVESVDSDRVVNAAAQSVHDLMLKSGFLPMDLGIVDLTPPTMGEPPARTWVAFASGYDALVDRYAAWAREARPDHALVRAMLASLDDNHTTFIDRDDYRRMSENTYVGIGVRLSKPEPNQAPVVVEVFRGSPAAQAGIKAGDRIEAVDGASTGDVPLTEIVKLIRGTVGTRVQISISRRAQSERMTADVNRAAVEPRRVEGGTLGSGVGYIRIRGFSSDVPNQVFDLLNRNRTAGLRGLVLDLRGNTGGALNAVANVGGAFFPGKPLGISLGRDGAQEPIKAEGRKLVGDDPIVVLIDRDTGSGAEILAAALREHQVATIVGTSSAGSVGIAQVHQLSDGSAVQITERRLLAPSGQRLDRVGVKPDIEVPTSVPDLEAGKDPPLERAIQLIQQGTRTVAGV